MGPTIRFSCGFGVNIIMVDVARTCEPTCLEQQAGWEALAVCYLSAVHKI